MARKPGGERHAPDLRLNLEERLRLIEENVVDYALFTVDPEGFVASWNAGAERILGYTEAEALSMNCEAIFTPEDRAAGAHLQERETAAREGRAADERWHLRKDGVRIWGSGIMTALRSEAGDLRGYVKILRDETARHLAEQQREQTERARAELERREAIVAERERIARDLHDTLAQGFTGILIQLQAAEDLLEENTPAAAYLTRAQGLARDSLREARSAVQALRPDLLENGVEAAFRKMAGQITDGTGVKVAVTVEGEVISLDHETQEALMRAGQEALTNALRHAEARNVAVRLDYAAGSVRLKVRDDGRGFDPHSPVEGFGLRGLRERAERLGGQLTLESTPGRGTEVIFTMQTAPPEG